MEMESLKFIGAGVAALGMMGAALGVGMIFAALMNGIARNPAAEPKMKANAILGAAFAEIMGLLSFVVGMMMIA